MIHYLDLRTQTAEQVLSDVAHANFEAAYITAWQAAALGTKRLKRGKFVVTAPDFLNYARLLNTGQAMAMAALPGSLAQSALAGGASGFQSISRLPRLAKMDFWAVAEVLLRYDFALLPKGYSGPVCLHSHLMDFAAVFDHEDFVRAFYNLAGKRAGVHTQQLPAALSCLARWRLAPNVLSFLCATGDIDGNAALHAARESNLLAEMSLIAEMDSWPADLQKPDVAQHQYPQQLAGISTALNRQL